MNLKIRRPTLLKKFSSFLILSFILAHPQIAFALERKELLKAGQYNASAIEKMKEKDFDKKDLDGAELDLLKASVYSNEEPKVRENLGVVYYEKGLRSWRLKKNFNEAEHYLCMAIDIDPDNETYKKGLSEVIYYQADRVSKEGFSDEAFKLYKKVTELDPTNIMAWTQAAFFAWKIQDIQSARAYLEKAKSINPRDKNVKMLEDKLKNLPIQETSHKQNSEHFIITADRKYLDTKKNIRILEELESIYSEISYQLSTYPKDRISVTLCSREEFYRHWKFPRRVTAVYDGKLWIPYDENFSSISEMRSIVKHELAHYFIRSLAKGDIPRWINEGLAQWIEGRRLSRAQRDQLMTNQTIRRLPDLAHLDEILASQKNPWNDADMISAYMKSFSVVEFMINAEGVSAILNLIKVFDSKKSLDHYLKKYYNMDLRELEKSWIWWIERKEFAS